MSNSFINLTKNMENEKKMGGGQVGPIWSSNFSLNSAACMNKIFYEQKYIPNA
jgi:hypothetical protein